MYEFVREIFFQNASPDVVKVLVGNKCEAATNRAVDTERGQKVIKNDLL